MIDSYSMVGLLHPPRKRHPRPVIADLTLAEYETLRALAEAINKYDNPTLKEIAACSKSVRYPQMVHEYLRRLEAKGYVSVNRTRARSVKMLRPLPERTE